MNWCIVSRFLLGNKSVRPSRFSAVWPLKVKRCSVKTSSWAFYKQFIRKDQFSGIFGAIYEQFVSSSTKVFPAWAFLSSNKTFIADISIELNNRNLKTPCKILIESIDTSRVSPSALWKKTKARPCSFTLISRGAARADRNNKFRKGGEA